jgi:DNA polymerase-3 subunit delta'
VPDALATLPGQPEAGRLLGAAAEHPGHAYLLAGPRGAGMDGAANAFAARLLDTTPERIAAEAHPDVVVVEPEGAEIRIEQVRALRADLHLRPFAGERRVYVVRDAHALGRDAANALLKSLEEPPEYAVFVLVSSDRGRLLPTIESRCQVVRFRALSTAAITEALGGGEEARASARRARGDLTLARRLHGDDDARALADRVAELTRAAVLDDGFDAGAAASELLAAARRRGDHVEAAIEARRDAALALLPAGREGRRERGQVERLFEALAKRRRRRAETEELLLAVDLVSSDLRDALALALGAESAVVSWRRRDGLMELAERLGASGATVLLDEVRETRRAFDLPVNPSLALESLFHRIGLRLRRAA